MRRVASVVALGLLAALGVACGQDANPVAPSANPVVNQPEGDKSKGIYWSEQQADKKAPSARTYGVVWSD